MVYKVQMNEFNCHVTLTLIAIVAIISQIKQNEIHIFNVNCVMQLDKIRISQITKLILAV